MSATRPGLVDHSPVVLGPALTELRPPAPSCDGRVELRASALDGLSRLRRERCPGPREQQLCRYPLGTWVGDRPENKPRVIDRDWDRDNGLWWARHW